MKTVVHDASMLIDLVLTGLLGLWLKIGLAAITTSLVWREVNRKSQKASLARFVESGELTVVSIGSEDMTRIVRLQANLLGRVSLEDAIEGITLFPDVVLEPVRKPLGDENKGRLPRARIP